MLKDECYPKRRLDRKTEESITSSARAGTRKRKELSIWLKRPTNVLYLYTLISYQSATLALPLRYKANPHKNLSVFTSHLSPSLVERNEYVNI